jgi:hypothetical protein
VAHDTTAAPPAAGSNSTTASMTPKTGGACRMQKAWRAGLGPAPRPNARRAALGGSWRVTVLKRSGRRGPAAAAEWRARQAAAAAATSAGESGSRGWGRPAAVGFRSMASAVVWVFAQRLLAAVCAFFLC